MVCGMMEELMKVNLGMSYKDIEEAMNDPKSPNREKYEKNKALKPS